MRISIALALLASVALPGAAHAADGGFYGSLSLGGASVNDVDSTVFAPGGDIFFEDEGDFTGSSVPAGSDTITGEFDVKTAFMISGSLGYDWGMFRTDVEVSYARSKVRAFNVTGGSASGTPVTQSEAFEGLCFYNESDCPATGNSVPLDGSKLRQLNAMANVWIDIPVGGELGLEPYVGGGLGVAGFEVDGEGKARFAWQLGGGLAYKISPNIAITADARYRQANSTTINDEGYGFVLGKVKTFSYGLGLRATF